MAVSVPSGPISRKRVTPWASSSRIPSAKRTAARTCVTQYSGDCISSSATASRTGHVRDERELRRRGTSARSATRRNSSSIGSISGEWKAWRHPQRRGPAPKAPDVPGDTRRPRPACRKAPPPRSVDRRDPEVGPRSPAAAAPRPRTPPRATIAPPAGSACINRPRAQPPTARVRQRHHPGYMCCAISPMEWPTSTVRAHTPGLHQAEQCDFDREQTRLRAPGRFSSSASSPDDLPQRPVQLHVQPTAHRIEGLREHRKRLVQLPAHAEPLRALTREQERQLADRVGSALRDSLGPLALASAARRRRSSSRRRRAQRRGRAAPTGEPRATRPRHGGSPRAGRRRARAAAPPVPARPARFAGQHPRQDGDGRPDSRSRLGGAVRVVRPGGGLRQRRLLQDHVGVGAADPEGRRPPRGADDPLPGHDSRCSVSSSTAPADQSTCGDGSSTCSVARQHTVPHRHHHLDHTRHTRSRLGVPDVRLHRAQPQRPPSPRSWP